MHGIRHWSNGHPGALEEDLRRGPAIRNLLLGRLSPSDLALLRPHLEPVELPARAVLQSPGSAVDAAYFVERGLASVLVWAGQEKIEIGLVGFEGVIGLPILDGVRSAPFEVIVQKTLGALRVPAEDLSRAASASASLALTLRLFGHVQQIQAAVTALANGRHTVEQRLARWLLMAQDRIGGDEVALTHDFLAVMLGVRRPGVTVALHLLEGSRAIRSRRNSIRILDRDKLKEAAGASYGLAEAAYRELLDERLSA